MERPESQHSSASLAPALCPLGAWLRFRPRRGGAPVRPDGAARRASPPRPPGCGGSVSWPGNRRHRAAHLQRLELAELDRPLVADRGRWRGRAGAARSRPAVRKASRPRRRSGPGRRSSMKHRPRPARSTAGSSALGARASRRASSARRVGRRALRRRAPASAAQARAGEARIAVGGIVGEGDLGRL